MSYPMPRGIARARISLRLKDLIVYCSWVDTPLSKESVGAAKDDGYHISTYYFHREFRTEKDVSAQYLDQGDSTCKLLTTVQAMVLHPTRVDIKEAHVGKLVVLRWDWRS